MSDVAMPAVAAAIDEPGLQADQQLVDRAWLRIGIGLAVAGQAMVFSLAVNVTPADGVAYWVVHGGLLASALAVLIFLGGDLVGSAWAALRDRRVSIDLLFLVTLLGALGGSLVSTLSRTGAIFYELVAVLVVVHTTGKMLGARSRLAALRAVADMREAFDRCRVRRPDGSVVEKPAGEVQAEDVVLVAVGGAICVDGEIIEGRAYIEETSMTGEWRPVARGPGEPVLAGTRALDGLIVVRPKIGPRKIDAILAEVARARVAPSRLQRQADRLMAWFLPLVCGVSLATFVVWWWLGPWTQALFNAMAVLLVACPCAMGLATPVAVWGGLARLASLGLVARSGDFLDALARADTVCFDKTGTLSGDRLTVTAWTTAPEWAGREDWLRAAVHAVESPLTHPVAQALAAHCHGRSGDSPVVRIEGWRTEPGLGVVAWVEDDSGWREVRVGERGLHADVPDECGASDQKRVYVSVDGRPAAMVALGESWRAGLAAAMGELKQLGLEVEVLTGDPHPPAGLGAVVRGGLSPADKVARMRALTGEGHEVIFVGDGVNDAAAMSAAAAGVAVRGGSDLARAASMAVFSGDDLCFLPQAVRVARRVIGGVRGNLLFAGAYNLLGMALAAGGVLHPVVAALLMVGSSAWVSVRAMRSARMDAVG